MWTSPNPKLLRHWISWGVELSLACPRLVHLRFSYLNNQSNYIRRLLPEKLLSYYLFIIIIIIQLVPFKLLFGGVVFDKSQNKRTWNYYFTYAIMVFSPLLSFPGNQTKSTEKSIDIAFTLTLTYTISHISLTFVVGAKEKYSGGRFEAFIRFKNIRMSHSNHIIIDL